MTHDQVKQLALQGFTPTPMGIPEIIETHISWVIIYDVYVFKIKKPIKYSFLDFSTIEKRKYYCEKEILLNKRLTENIYLDVVTIVQENDLLKFETRGKIIDYAVRMNRVDADSQMNKKLISGSVNLHHIELLGLKIASFHQHAVIINNENCIEVQHLFNDIENELPFLKSHLSSEETGIISSAIHTSDQFLNNHKQHLLFRLANGFFRDCHGDLHTRNIFLLQTPQPFDCIEFNDAFREIDVLNDVAFLCMDLDAFNRHDLSEYFIKTYNLHFKAINNTVDEQLFIYYKMYRANIRAKVNCLRAKSSINSTEKNVALTEVKKYIALIKHYLQQLNTT